MAAITVEYEHFRRALPPGWVIETKPNPAKGTQGESEDNPFIVAIGPEQNGFRPNLVISQEPTNPRENAADFAARALPQLRQAFQEFTTVREGIGRFGLNTGFLREHTFRVGDVQVAQLQFYVVIDGLGYSLTFSHLKDELGSVKPLAERLFAQALRPMDNARVSSVDFEEF